MSKDEPAEALDVDHLADLANLPLDEEEKRELAMACQEVLDAFALPDVEPAEPDEEPTRWLDDEAEPWPEDGVEAILDEVPRRDGRHIRG